MFAYYLNLGSNLGNRQLNIHQAECAIERALGSVILCRSIDVESKPWGFSSANTFVNRGIKICSALTPHEVLAELKTIERDLGSLSHRDSDGNYIDRLIDIDIMEVERISDDGTAIQQQISTPTLTVPHPHISARPFFSIPLAQLHQSPH